MNKAILSVAIIFASFTGFTMSAQDVAPQCQADKCEMQCEKSAKSAKCVKGKFDKAVRHEDRVATRHQHGKMNPFEGIDLTTEQQAKIDAFRQEKGCLESQNCEKPTREQRKAKMEAMKEEMKQILTPEQYEQFEQNLQKIEHGRRQGMRPEGKRHTEAKECTKDCKKAECDKADCKKECKKSDYKKEDCKKDCKKADFKKDCKKDCKKSDCKKAESEK